MLNVIYCLHGEGIYASIGQVLWNQTGAVTVDAVSMANASINGMTLTTCLPTIVSQTNLTRT